jgi:hypothetical protein
MFRFFFLLFVLFGASSVQSKWLLVYVMPYDNDLSLHEAYVEGELQKYHGDTEVALIKALPESTVLECSLRSASDSLFWTIDQTSITKEALTSFLLRTASWSKADQSAVFFLDHGGNENQLGLDLQPAEHWLGVDEAASACQVFSKRCEAKLELIHLQVCSKAHLDALYEFGRCTPFILASAFPLGAPNHYYQGMFADLNAGNVRSGEELAGSILLNERSDMFLSLSLFDTEVLYSLAEAFLKSLTQTKVGRMDFRAKSMGKYANREEKELRKIHYGEHKYADFSDVLFLLFPKNEAEKLFMLAQEALIWHMVSATAPEIISEYFGLSLALPAQKKALRAPDLEFWKSIQ